MTQAFIPWAKPDFWGNESKYVMKALESTWISGGHYVEQLETEVKNYLDTIYALSSSNGTTALHMAYLGLGLKHSDEIIVPGFGFMATANVAIHMGLKPIFAEVDPDSWCVTAETIAPLITSRTKAIVVIHTYGNICDMDSILALANEHNIPVVEDVAEAFASRYKGRFAGVFGTIGTFSFHATKTITTGEGGMVITQQEDIYERMWLYRNHGMKNIRYWHELPGYNFRLTNLQAAIGVAQMEKLDAIIENRERVYRQYKKHLGNVKDLALQTFDKDVHPVVWVIAVKLDEKAFPERDSVINTMLERNVETRPGFYAASMMDIYDTNPLPICENISRQIISLPSFPTLSNEQIDYICETLLELRASL